MEKLVARLKAHAESKTSTQGGLYAVVGLYLVYLAYSIISSSATGKSTMSLGTEIVFGALFVISGIALAVLGLYSVRYNYNRLNSSETEEEEQSE